MLKASLKLIDDNKSMISDVFYQSERSKITTLLSQVDQNLDEGQKDRSSRIVGPKVFDEDKSKSINPSGKSRGK